MRLSGYEVLKLGDVVKGVVLRDIPENFDRIVEIYGTYPGGN